MTALDRCCDDLTAAARRLRRQRIAFLATQYERARDLPRIAPSFGTRPGHPFSELRPGCRNDTAATRLSIIADLAERRRNLQADIRGGRYGWSGYPEGQAEAINIALLAECRAFRAQRRAAIARALQSAGFRPAAE